MLTQKFMPNTVANDSMWTKAAAFAGMNSVPLLAATNARLIAASRTCRWYDSHRELDARKFYSCRGDDFRGYTQFLLKAEGSNTWPEKLSPLELAASWAGAAVAMTLSCNLPLLHFDCCSFAGDLPAACLCSALCMPDDWQNFVGKLESNQ